jgi:hypothetical protein
MLRKKIDKNRMSVHWNNALNDLETLMGSPWVRIEEKHRLNAVLMHLWAIAEFDQKPGEGNVGHLRHLVKIHLPDHHKHYIVPEIEKKNQQNHSDAATEFIKRYTGIGGKGSTPPAR